MDFPNIDPIIFAIPAFEVFGFEIGPIAARWYGLTYVVGFFSALWLAQKRAALPNSGWNKEQVSDFLFYAFISAVIGGRFGYVLFYQFDAFMQEPSILLRITDGGMSFHGGLIGVALFEILYGRAKKRHPLAVADFFAPFVPLGLAAGRIGNFINAELWGREVSSDFWLAMRFPTDPQGLYRHPSQLYEFALEGVMLFIILYWFSKKPRPMGSVSGLFLVGYGSFRFIVEFFREPDSHLGFIFGQISMGQILSTPMIVIGLAMIVWGYRQHQSAEGSASGAKA